MKPQLPHERSRRAQGAYVVLALLMTVLLAAFFRIQVLRSDTWELRAESNRIRQLPVPAPRGTIYDRHGRIMADNSPGYAITLMPAAPDSIRATLQRMRRYMSISDERVERLMAFLRRYGRQPLVVDADAPFEVVSALEERRAEFPEVYIEMRPRRRYPVGAAAGHVLGYTSEITPQELDSTFAAGAYEPGMSVGKVGVEREYEELLQGRRGLKYVEVDARGRIIGDFGAFRLDPGEPGEDLHLNLDMELHEWIHHIFPDSMSGAVVAIDPADGGILALYSAPAYDPNAFVGGIDDALWLDLNTDVRKPLYNRAVLGLYAPASTWKLAAAGIALDVGAVTPDEFLPVPCTGSFTWGNRTWRCHLAAGHGYQNLAQAIGNSCDVYFYQLGLRVGLDRMLERATDVGFSRRCGVDLPQESEGIFPAGRDYWRRVFGYDPLEGEVLNLAIGQGPNSQTPLKMAQFYTALARDGSAPAPALARGVELEVEGWSLHLAPEHIASLHEGLRMVTAPGGTAHLAGTLEHWEVLGKTGTGQNPLSLQGLAPDHAWFAAIVGPFGGPPEIVVVVLVEYGRSGSQVAAPIASKAADYYLRRRHGIPVDTIQTLRDHIMVGPYPRWYRERYPRPVAGGTP